MLKNKNLDKKRIREEKKELKKELKNVDMYKYFLEKRLKELIFLEQHRFNKEYFIFIYSKDKKSIIEKDELILRITNENIKLKLLDLDKKIKILFKLNNQNSKI